MLKLIRSLAILFLMLSLTASPARAHDGGTSANLWQHWSWLDLPGLALIGALYARGLRALWERAGTGSGIRRGQALAFGVGMLALLIALVSPLDFLSEELFSAHMVQHLLLMLVAAPLFVIGRFPLAVAWTLPSQWTSKIWKGWKGEQVWKFLTLPMGIFLFHNAAVWLWHMPKLYEAAFQNGWFHFLEHASFFLTAFLFWQVFADLTESMHRGHSVRFGLGIFLVFGTMLVSGFLGVLIAFSPYVWYAVHVHEAAVYGLTPLEDQQLAGTLMWVPAGVVYLGAAIGVIGRWLFVMEAVENPQS